MQDTIDLKSPHRPIRVGVILLGSETELLDIAPIDIFTSISKKLMHQFPPELVTDEITKQALDIEFYWATEHGQEGELTAGATIKPTHDFKTCPSLDIVLMGAHNPNYNMTDGEKAFIRKCNSNCVAFLFVCASFMVALQTGLLESKTATAPRFMLEQLRKAHPGVKWVEKRWAHDGKIWTTGTLLNGIDMTQAFALETWGGEGSLVELVVRLGGYPCRDIDYADVPWKF